LHVIDELSGHCGLPSLKISGIAADVTMPAAKGKLLVKGAPQASGQSDLRLPRWQRILPFKSCGGVSILEKKVAIRSRTHSKLLTLRQPTERICGVFNRPDLSERQIFRIFNVVLRT
jgi:hypothetical protein